MKKRWARITAAILFTIIILMVVVNYLIDEPIRRYFEREMNRRLKGYSVHIQALKIHPLSFSAELQNVLVVQQENPKPPVADIGEIKGGVHWRDLLTGHIVADAVIRNPKIHINIRNLRAEVSNPPQEKEAWQDALGQITPFEINEFRIRNGELTYVESAKGSPLTVTGIQFTAHNVRNVKSPEKSYPSRFSLEAVLFGSELKAAGQADFMLKPHAAVTADITLQNLDIAQLRDVALPRGIAIRKGSASAAGTVEFTPDRKIFILHDFVLNGAAVDYLHSAKEPEKTGSNGNGAATEQAKEAGKKVVDKPGLLIKAKRIRILDSDFGFVNKTSEPEYRIFMADLNLELHNFSNRFREGPAELFMKGQFMGSGETAASATFRPEKDGPDFNLRVAIKNTRMKSMNNAFRAYGKFDVSAGFFSYYSELAVSNGRITGYVKPLFREMKVFDRRTDKEKSDFKKLYEKIVGGIINLLENLPRDEVATEITISGRLENPDASTWQVIANLIENAFFQAILPGFEKNIK